MKKHEGHGGDETQRAETQSAETPRAEARSAEEATRPAEEAKASGAGAEPVTEAIARLEKERDEYLELARRSRADYMNLQRRLDAQRAAIRSEVQQRFALDMIAVLDDLDRALEHASEIKEAEALVKGIMLVRQNFLAALARHGITPIKAMGAAFDPNLHHAIAEQPSDDVPTGTIVTVVQTGFTAEGKLLRPAQVVVARAFEEGSREGGDADANHPEGDSAVE
jgi:molecular chaperone GrpE